MIIADIMLLIICLAALLFAFITDIRSKEVPDWLNFALISMALGIRLIHAIVFSDWWYFLYGLIGFGAMFVLGVIIFYTKQWGGGDAKLLMGLGAVFGTKPYFIKPAPYLFSYQIPFLVMLLVNLLIVGAVYGILWGIYLFIKHRKKVIGEMIGLMREKRTMMYFYLALAIISFIPVFFIPYMRSLFMVSSLFLLIYPYLFISVKAVEKVGMLKYVSTNDLVEGDWVAEKIRVNGKVICSPSDLGMELHQVRALKRAKIRKVLIKEGIAFVPPIFFGTILSLVFTDLIMLFL